MSGICIEAVRCSRVMVMDGKNPAHILMDISVEGQVDLLGNTRTSPIRITAEISLCDQYIGGPPPPGPRAAFSFSGISETSASVVSIKPAMDAAFCRAERVTL